jgi:hypothetical protein
MAPSDLEREIGHGSAGLIPWSALGDVEETVPELIGLNAITTYNKMRQDVKAKGTLPEGIGYNPNRGEAIRISVKDDE